MGKMGEKDGEIGKKKKIEQKRCIQCRGLVRYWEARGEVGRR